MFRCAVKQLGASIALAKSEMLVKQRALLFKLDKVKSGGKEFLAGSFLTKRLKALLSVGCARLSGLSSTAVAQAIRRGKTRRLVALRYACVLLSLSVLATPAANAGSSGTTTATIRGQSLTVHTYRPSSCSSPALLIVLHGNGRDARGYRDLARNLADQYCMLVFAPLFDERRFPSWSYHRGGIVDDDGDLRARSQWTVGYVTDLVAWARAREKRRTAAYYLFGHSAGAQFLSRVAAFTQPSAKRIVIANPSTHVLPSVTEDAPYGLDRVYLTSAAEEAQLRGYLALPITIYLGEDDDDPNDPDLTGGSAADRQGIHRLDRGQKTFAMGQSLAAERGWPFGWKLVIAEDVAHSAGEMLRAPERAAAFGLRQ